ncbi:hypothetical protein Pelo_7150 [Pelomyxa schiedti]|nr:hypothetical protein Pelo_7150 [Pelomyxa schiedti]
MTSEKPKPPAASAQEWPFALVYDSTTSPIDDVLLCAVCKQALVEPVVHQGGCGDMVCRACIAGENERLLCPVCGGCMKAGSMVPAPRVIMSKLNNLLVVCPTCQKSVKRGESIDHYQRCPSKCKNGCGELVEPVFYKVHNRTCLGTVVRCDRCSTSMTRSVLQEHKMECPVDCPQGCGQHIAPKDQSAHNAVCPEVQVQCPLFMFQCKWLGKRKDQKSHTDKCTAVQDFVVGLKKENSKLKEEIKTLSEKNLELQKKKEQLEAELQGLRGPYFDFVTICNKEEEIENQHPAWNINQIMTELSLQCPGAYQSHFTLSKPCRVRYMRTFINSTLPDTRTRIQALLQANENITCHWKADEFALPEWSWLTADQQVSVVESMLQTAANSISSQGKSFPMAHIPFYIAEAAKKYCLEGKLSDQCGTTGKKNNNKKKKSRKKQHKRSHSTTTSHSHSHSHSRSRTRTPSPSPSPSSVTSTSTERPDVQPPSIQQPESISQPEFKQKPVDTDGDNPVPPEPKKHRSSPRHQRTTPKCHHNKKDGTAHPITITTIPTPSPSSPSSSSASASTTQTTTAPDNTGMDSTIDIDNISLDTTAIIINSTLSELL